VWERLQRSKVHIEGPTVGGRELSERIERAYRRALHEHRVDRPVLPKRVADASTRLRNRVVLQEMKNVYNRLAGVGDMLVDARLARLRTADRSVTSLSRRDLERLNDEIASLAASIFDERLAAWAHGRIGEVIQRALE
jgi:hypothetical protein